MPKSHFPLLSICVPTYRNAVGVAALLAEIVRQADEADLRSYIEICISDNSADTETETVVRDQENTSRVRYSRNATNIGYDRNVEKVLNIATGDYCWLLSDNDPICPHALEAILNALKDDPAVGYFIIAPAHITPDKLRRYVTFQEAIETNNYWIPGGLVSRNIFARKLIPPDLSPYFGNDWIHLSIAFLIGGAHPVRFIEEQLIEETSKASSWAKDGKTFETFTNLMQIVRDLPSMYSSIFKKNLLATFTQRLPREILSSKLYGLRVNRKTLEKLRAATDGRPFLFIVSSAALLVPTSLLRYAKRLKTSAHH